MATTWSVAESSGFGGHAWQLLATADGISSAVAVFCGADSGQAVAVRCRDLLNRHGTVDVPLDALEMP